MIYDWLYFPRKFGTPDFKFKEWIPNGNVYFSLANCYLIVIKFHFEIFKPC